MEPRDKIALAVLQAVMGRSDAVTAAVVSFAGEQSDAKRVYMDKLLGCCFEVAEAFLGEAAKRPYRC